MSDQYDLTWSNVAKTGFSVLPQTKDTTSTSLTITGRGSPNWGKDLQENLLWLLENFASDTAPAHPTKGQLWYNTSSKTLFVYDATAVGGPWVSSSGTTSISSTSQPSSPVAGQFWWNPNFSTTGGLFIYSGSAFVQVWPLSKEMTVRVAYVTEYNTMVDMYNKVVGTVQGSTTATGFGYGQPTIAHESISTMTNAKWISFINTLTIMLNFLGISTTGLGTNGFIYESGNTLPDGIAALLTQYNTTLAALTTMNTLARYTPALASLESTTPAGGTATRSTPWSGTITHEVVGTFPDATTMKMYFNSGGKFQFTPTLSSPSTTRDTAMQAFLNTLGTIKFAALGSVSSNNVTGSVGFYDLTSSYQTVFTYTSGTTVFSVQAKTDAVNIIHFKLSYTNPGTLYGGVGGTLTSTTVLVRALNTIINSPVITYPTLASTALV